MPRQQDNSRRGFTILELMLALSLFVLLAAMAWPLVQSQIVAAELPESASRMRSLLYLTRTSAMLEHRRHRLRFSPDGQQPVVEIEPDPILEPGRFVPVIQDWATDPPLLSDVQVHRVLPGRPAYMRPVSATEGEATDPLQVEEPVADDVSAGVQSTAAKFQAAMSDGLGGQQAEIDERRPSILFEADGSTDWATVILSRIKPTEELSEQESQAWVVIDGRTGLALINDGVTQEQLDDPTFYVDRDKLDLPEEMPVDELTLDASALEEGSSLGAGPDLQQGVGDTSALLQQPAGQNPGESGETSQPVDPTLNPDQLAGQPAEQPTEQKDALQQLEEQLANSNLSDAEKDEIRRNFQDSQSKAGQVGTKSPK